MESKKVQVSPVMGTRYILVEIGEDKTTIEAIGFNGRGCHAATKPFEDALGGKVVDTKEKPPEGVSCGKVTA